MTSNPPSFFNRVLLPFSIVHGRRRCQREEGRKAQHLERSSTDMGMDSTTMHRLLHSNASVCAPFGTIQLGTSHASWTVPVIVPRPYA